MKVSTRERVRVRSYAFVRHETEIDVTQVYASVKMFPPSLSSSFPSALRFSFVFFFLSFPFD